MPAPRVPAAERPGFPALAREGVPLSAPASISIVQTKLYRPPPRPNLVVRSRLLRKLDSGLDAGHRLTLISAPAGYGKTTLVSEWLDSLQSRQDRPVSAAWLSLDEQDNDPARFWTHVIAALQHAQVGHPAKPGTATRRPGLGRTVLALLQVPRRPPIQALLPGLLNEMASMPGRSVLVLDDYHLLLSIEIHDSLAFAIEHLPPTVHLVVSTRTDPPLPLPRLRARDQLTEVRAAHLRFTLEEAEDFLNRLMELGLSAENVGVLGERTEGWIAGLQMAALSIQGQDAESVDRLIAGFSGRQRFILDYLADEVLSRQPESVQSFLLDTSILERLSGPLCDAVTEREGTWAILEALDKANLFVVSLDADRCWYRYHHLFADLLSARVQRTSPERMAQLHARASSWFEANGYDTAAIDHALAAKDMDRSVRLLERTAAGRWRPGELSALARRIAGLPREVVRARPWLLAARALYLTDTGKLDEAEELLCDAEALTQKGPRARELSGLVAYTRAHAADLRGDARHAMELASAACDLLEVTDSARLFATLVLNDAAFLEGDLARAEQACQEALGWGQERTGAYFTCITLCVLGEVRKLQGRLHAAADLYRQALETGNVSNAAWSQAAAQAGVGLAHVLYEWNDLDGAGRHATQAVSALEPSNDFGALAFAYCRLASVQQAQGHLGAAAATLEKAKEVCRKWTVYPDVTATVEAREVLFWVAESNLGALEQWVCQVQDRESHPSPRDSLGFVSELRGLSLVRALIALNRSGEAVALMEPLVRAAEAGGRAHRLVQLLALQARALEAGGDTAAAVAATKRCLALAEPEGYVRVFVDQGPQMAHLIRLASVTAEHRSEGSGRDYIEKLLAAFWGPGSEPALSEQAREQTVAERTVSGQVSEQLVEPLTQRELEVLEFLREGLSNKEIAERLFLSPNTLRFYTYTIYSKLGVHSRMMATVRAQELGLLPLSRPRR